MNKFHTQFNPPPRPASPHGGISLTDASALPDTDILTVVRRYNAGDASVVREVGNFGDFSECQDFASMMERVREARERFAALPATLRDRFGNDPAALVKFVSDSANDEEAIKLGLKVRVVPEKTLEDKIVDAVTSATQKVESSTGDSSSATPTT